MNTRFQLLLFTLLTASAACYAADPLVSDHQRWVAQIQRLDDAVERDDVQAARETSLVVFQQALFFAEHDRRLPKTSIALQKVRNTISDLESLDATMAWLASLSVVAAQHGYLARPISAAVVLERLKLMGIRGDHDGAAKLAAVLARAAAEKDGPVSKYVLAARVAGAQIAVGQQDYPRAQQLLEALATD